MKTCRSKFNAWQTAAAVAIICTAGSAWGQTRLSTSGSTGSYSNPLDVPSCGGTQLTQNTNPDTLAAGTVSCNAGGVNTDNFYARNFPIAAPIFVKCVDFGVEVNNAIGATNVRVRLYTHPTPGTPVTANLVLIPGSEMQVPIPANTTLLYFNATYPGVGIAVPAGNMVVELFTPCRQLTCVPPGDGGSIFLGSNGLGQSAPSYIKAAACGAADYTDLATLGFPNVHMVMRLGLASGNPCQVPLPPCRADVTLDTLVNVNDLLAVINTWGQNNPTGPRPQGDCDPLPNGNCLVNVNDLLTVINAWGPCPVEQRACCFANGTCQNLGSAACATAGGTWQGAGSTCATTTCPVAPPNDNCAGAISVPVGATNINNASATNSTGIPGGACIAGGATNISKDLWYKHTATCTGSMQIDTCATTGAVTDTTLQVYTGPCTNLAEVACDDDACTGNPAGDRSKVIFAATLGTQYYIRVGTWAATPSGAMVLTIACAAADDDNCADATLLTVNGPCVSRTLATATQDTAPICNGISAGVGRWFKVAGNGTTLTANTCTSPLQFWDARISVYCGTCTSLFCVTAVNADACGGPSRETVSWCSEVGRNYLILVHAPSTPTTPDGDFILCVTGGATCGNPPNCGLANDGCAGATLLAVPSTTNGTTLAATPAVGPDPELPAGSPSCQWQAPPVPTNVHNTVWYKFVATGTGVTVATCSTTGTFVDSIIALYSGTCGSLVQIACGEDECGGTFYLSQMTATTLTTGQTYYIMVGHPGGWGGEVLGAFVLTLTAPAPPCVWTCPAGSVLEGEPCATVGPDITNGGCNSTPAVWSTNLAINGPAVCGLGSTFGAGTRDTDWYLITATVTGNHTITVNAEFAALYGLVATPCPQTVFISSSTTSGNCNQTTLSVSLTAGVSYFVFVAPGAFTGWGCAAGLNDYWVKVTQP